MLNAAAEKGDWGKPLPPGVHRGIAQFMGYGSYSAATAEVSVSRQGKVKVHRMVLALNCGHAVNPDQIAAQATSVFSPAASGAFATIPATRPPRSRPRVGPSEKLVHCKERRLPLQRNEGFAPSSWSRS